MKVSKRLAAWCLSFIATGLTVYGTVLAATDPNPSGVYHDPLALQGYPPSSAKISLSINTSSGPSLTANVAVDFAKNIVSGTGSMPNLLGNFTFYWSNNQLDLSSSAIDAGHWFGVKEQLPALFGYSLELTQPDIDLISGFSDEVISRSNTGTTYTFTSEHSSLVSPFGVHASSDEGSMTWVIATGSQGEVIGTSLRMSHGGETTSLEATVTSYNQADKKILTPTQVQLLSASELSLLQSTLSKSGVVLPSGLLG